MYFEKIVNKIDVANLKPIVVGLMAVFAASTHAAPTLLPMLNGAAPAGAGGGLAGQWYKVDDQARFSNYPWQEAGAPATAVRNFAWGTGLWSTSDIADIASGRNPYVTGTARSVSAVSFANDLYNDAYGNSPWRVDGKRPIAPIVTAQGGGEENYAAVFTGYLHVAKAGLYDLGVFADDGFAFSLKGANGLLQMGQDSVANSTGRSYHSLADDNGLTGKLALDVGYYGIDLSYYNRLEAGVIDLGWTGPDDAWRLIGPESLYPGDPNQVPEPASAALLALGLVGIWSGRRHKLRRLRTTQA